MVGCCVVYLYCVVWIYGDYFVVYVVEYSGLILYECYEFFGLYVEG